MIRELIKVLRDEWQTGIYLILVIGVVLWVIALFGCAAEPESPITAYRVMYGFEPARGYHQQLEE
jgi:hypothetical protein